MLINTERLNEIRGTLSGSVWHFMGPIKIDGDLFQCWVWVEGVLYCCSHFSEWDAAVVQGPAVTAGVWDGEMTARLREFSS